MPQKPKTVKIASGPNIRFEEASSKRRSAPRRVTISIIPDELVGGFVNFLRSHTIVTLAVGFIIATQAQTMVRQLVDSFITPTYQLFFKGSLAKDAVTWHLGSNSANFLWGMFVNDLLDFMFVLVAIYLIIRFFRLDKLDIPKK